MTTRRDFLAGAAYGTALGLGDLGFLRNLQPVSASDLDVKTALASVPANIEPTVRLLEDTSRERLLEKVGAGIKSGQLSYNDLLAALLLAGVRNVQPRPHVGFKFHAVLVVNSAHLASLASPAQHRWLPLFWALDYFKSSQAATQRESGWRMRRVKETRVPDAAQARSAFVDAMDHWDEEAADAAISGLARTASPQEVFETVVFYGARDFRDIGHKAIYVANAFRTLQCIGWQYAEPVLRSLTYALLQRESGNPAQQDLPPDRPGRRNAEGLKKIKPQWSFGKPSDHGTQSLLTALRQNSESEVCQQVIDQLNGGVAPSSLWDGLFVGAAELLMRQPGIVALHALTSANALRFAYATTASDDKRRFLLLQCAAFLPLFRQAMIQRGPVSDVRIDAMEPWASKASRSETIAEILADIGPHRDVAARKVLALAEDGVAAKHLIDAARTLVFLKGTDSHDYKFSSAVFEDFHQVAPAWRARLLAASVYKWRGSNEANSSLPQRVNAALA